MAKKKPAKNPDALNFLKEKDLKKLVELGKSRGVLTFDEVNDLIPSDVVETAKVDAIMEFLADSDIEVDDSTRAKADDDSEASEGDNGDGIPVESFLAKKKKGDDEDTSARSNDPVKLYLRKMGSVSLLTREGEVETAKRIEQGEEAIVRAL